MQLLENNKSELGSDTLLGLSYLRNYNGPNPYILINLTLVHPTIMSKPYYHI